MTFSELMNYRINQTPLSLDRWVLATALLVPVYYFLIRTLLVTSRNLRDYRKLLNEGVTVDARLVAIRSEQRTKINPATVEEISYSEKMAVLEFRLDDNDFKIEHPLYYNRRGKKKLTVGSIYKLRVLPLAPDQVFLCEDIGNYCGQTVPFLSENLQFSTPVGTDRLTKISFGLFLLLYPILLLC